MCSSRKTPAARVARVRPNTCAPTVTLSGHGGPGSALLFQSVGITATLGGCAGTDPATYGPDGIYCTADDPPGGIIAATGTFPAVTGTASAVVHNANGSDGADLGPVVTTGAPFSCAALKCGAQSSAAGGGFVGAFAVVHLDTIGDVAATDQLFAAGALRTLHSVSRTVALTATATGLGTSATIAPTWRTPTSATSMVTPSATGAIPTLPRRPSS